MVIACQIGVSWNIPRETRGYLLCGSWLCGFIYVIVMAYELFLLPELLEWLSRFLLQVYMVSRVAIVMLAYGLNAILRNSIRILNAMRRWDDLTEIHENSSFVHRYCPIGDGISFGIPENGPWFCTCH
jgi:hypothetical protein